MWQVQNRKRALFAIGVPGRAATARHGWWKAHQFLVLRRITQTGLLALFIVGPLFGIWIVKGTIAASLVFNVVPLTDPLILLQGLVARHLPQGTAFAGATIVLVVYFVLGGRSYCSWVCPVNPIADVAAYLRRRLGIGKGLVLRPATRWFVLAMVLVVSALTATIAWELINPVTAVWRSAVFGAGFGLSAAIAVFLFDLMVVSNGWCGHICPVGAFYGLLGNASLLRVSASARQRCDDCLECFIICPESHVIAPALRSADCDRSPVILSGDCTVCGRCVDICPERVFNFTHRFYWPTEAATKKDPSCSV